MPSAYWRCRRDREGSGQALRTWTSWLLLPITTHRSLTTLGTSSPLASTPTGMPRSSFTPYGNWVIFKAQRKCHSSRMPSPNVRINCSVFCPQYYQFITEAVTSLLVFSRLDWELIEDRDTVLLFTAPPSHNRSEWWDTRQLQGFIHSSPKWHQ